MAKISLIVAAASNNVIGGDNTLLWHIPEDLKFFKAKTAGHPIIMGRKTFDSIGRPLPKRTNIVITRNPDWQSEGVVTSPSLPDAIKTAQLLDSDEIFIIGGGTVYAAALQFATSVYLTRIHSDYTGDTYFPTLPDAQWQLVSEREGEQCDETGIRYTFLEYQRK